MRSHPIELAVLLAFSLLLIRSAVVSAAIPNEPAKESSHPPSVVLWPDGAPGSEARKGEAEKLDWRDEPENNITFPVLFNVHNPSITPFLPTKEKATGCAVIIAPGGGHMFHTIDREGYDLGKWLADQGIAAFVLKYRLARDRGGQFGYQTAVHALADAQRAIRTIRARSTEWGVKPDRIGIIGFSAGGQLAHLAGTKFDAGKADATDPIEKQSSRPDFMGLVYGFERGEIAYPENTPPAFLLCSFDDNGPANTLPNVFLKLKAARVPVEMHIYNSGGHGYGVRQDRPIPVATWPARFKDWLSDIKMLAK